MTASTLQNTDDGPIESNGGFRIGFISVLSGLIGILAAVIAFLIYHFIGFLYNLFFSQRLAFSFVEPPDGGLPLWIISSLHSVD